ncbi:MAG: tRNA dihydrouridine synthase DusB [Clostridiaceae bacterium]|jgi:tRNA-dihydrouridine synthase B|nr:tRNA dihydrouridine synthase DusB [Clostridiaceae bacterium]
MKTSVKIGNFTPRNNIFSAPMAGITDMPFRFLCAKMGAGLTCTEMVSSKGMYYNDKKTKQLTVIHPYEAPCAVQIFGSEPEIMAKAAEELNAREDVALIDINMGCPAPKIVKNGDGCALMRDEKLAAKIIKAVVKASKKPVTVKFRKGFDRDNAVEFAKAAEDSGASAITVHGRLKDQFYSGQSDMDTIARVKRSVSIPVIGNGDIFSPEDAKKMFETTGCDAVMVGRGARGNPWIFERIYHYIYNNELIPYPTDEEKLNVIKEHYKMMIELKGETTAVKEMRKHLAWYIKGMPGASKFRVEMYELTDAKDVISLIDEYFSPFCCNFCKN